MARCIFAKGLVKTIINYANKGLNHIDFGSKTIKLNPLWADSNVWLISPNFTRAYREGIDFKEEYLLDLLDKNISFVPNS